MPTKFHSKLIHEPPSDDDGYRILVDRLWPRGLAKAKAHLDLWAKDLAPSTELRKWFHADTSRYDEFAIKYRHELAERREDVDAMLAPIEEPTITLLSAV